MRQNKVERDPVCGMVIDREKCKLMSIYQGKEYRFCAANCKEAFEVAPEKYIVKGNEAEPDKASLKDLEEMSEIITTAIEIHGRERDFFTRSARNATGQVAKSLFSELADDLDKNLNGLVARKRKVTTALDDLRKVHEQEKEESIIVQDPVCGMRMNKAESKYISVYQGKEYYFCSESCKKAFDQAPQKYSHD